MSPSRALEQETVISEALWRVMSRGGPQQLTLRAVAAEAGCTTGLVTNRFPTKRALLLHARQMLHERTAARMLHTVKTTDDPVQALVSVLSDSSLRPEFDARIWVGFIAATLSDDELRSFHVTANRHFLHVISGLVARIRGDWRADEVEEESTRLVALVTGFAVLAAPDPAIYSTEAQVAAYSAAVQAIVNRG